MKKKLKILLLLIMFLLISGCNNKEYRIIHISAEDLINNINKGKTMIIFEYADNSINSKQMREDMQSIANDLRSDIYHLDNYHLDVEFGSILQNEHGISIDDNYFLLIDGNKIVLDEEYTNKIEVTRKLNNYQSSKDIELSSIDHSTYNINKAKEYFEEGNIYQANEYLSKAWSNEEAREFYYNNKEFNILHIWERYKTINNQADQFEYTQVNTFTGDSMYFKKTVKGKSGEFEKPNSRDRDNEYYYKVINKKIYTGLKEDKLSEKFEIVFINFDRLVLKDIKTNERIEYIRRD